MLIKQWIFDGTNAWGHKPTVTDSASVLVKITFPISYTIGQLTALVHQWSDTHLYPCIITLVGAFPYAADAYTTKYSGKSNHYQNIFIRNIDNQDPIYNKIFFLSIGY